MAVIGNPRMVPQALAQRKLIRFGVLREAWQLYVEKIGVWLLAAFVTIGIALFLQVAFSIVTGAFGPTKHTLDGTAPGAASPAAMVLMGLLSVVEWIVVSVLVGGMFRMATMQLRGEEITLGHLFEAVEVLPSLLGAAVLIGASGAFLFGIGVMFTAPLAILAVSVLYRDFFAYEPRWIGIRRAE